MDVRPSMTMAVVSTSPSNFAGAAAVHCRILCMLAARGVECHFIVTGTPFYQAELIRSGVTIHTGRVHSDAYPESDALAAAGIAKALYEQGRHAARNGREVVLCGTFLFPFFQSVLTARRLLAREGLTVRTVAIPAGSDIWQVGYQLPELVIDALNEDECSAVIAYSHSFALEIQQLTSTERPIAVTRPPLDVARYEPLNRRDRRLLRRQLGLRENAFTLLSCCNMRPVKRIDVTIDIALRLAAVSPVEVTLLLVGPRTPHLDRALASIAAHQSSARNLSIVTKGLCYPTMPYHQVADAAISTSVHDSFNVSIAESLAVGCP